MERTAFLSSFPSTESDFLRWWDRRQTGDYLMAQFPNVPNDRPEVAWMQFSQTAQKLEKEFECVTGWGVDVFPKASLSDLRISLESYQTVILLAHWRHSAFFDHHILNYEGVVQRLRTLQSCGAKGVNEIHFFEILRNQPNRLTSDDPRDVRDCLDWLISSHAGISVRSTKHSYAKSLQLAQARRELDKVLQPFVTIGNQLELWDGLTDHSSWNIQQINQRLNLDLLVCRSYDLAVALKKSLGGKATIIAGRLPVSILPRVLIATKALALCSEHCCDYSEAAIPLREAISKKQKGKFLWV